MTGDQAQRVGPRRSLPARAVVLGATGMVGRSWCGLLTAHGVPFRALARPAIDLARPETLAHTLNQGDTLVINAAAWTDVDGAEADEPGATVANAESVGVIACRCAAIGATLIHYSTDYVFSGHASSPYPIDAPIAPVNAYGRSKAAGEAAVARSGADHLIVRASWVYAPWGRNFVRTITSLAACRDEIRVVDDQRGRPTSAESLAATSLALFMAGAGGVWHAPDDGDGTWHDLAAEIVARLDLPCRVTPCRTAEFPRPAPRPAYSVLCLRDTDRLIGRRTPWPTALHRVLERFTPVP